MTEREEAINRAMVFCQAALYGNDRITDADLVTVVDDVLSWPPSVLKGARPERADLLAHLQARYSVYSDDYGVLSDESYRTWWPARRGVIEPKFWRRYHLYLTDRLGLPPDTVNHLDNLTDDILDHLADPAEGGAWDRRGMVVGQVQSGKTGNYIGLINKAADAGYRVIVILAGIHEGLRAQTQIRVDQGFLGYDTQTGLGLVREDQRVGVGKISEYPVAHSLTTGALGGDFDRMTAGKNLGGDEPVVMVVKKNAHILKSLVRWMGARGERLPDGRRLVRNAPLLVIDDEADNASINVDKTNVSRINGLVRALLSVFERSSYVGYTATPFANIFIPVLDAEDYEGSNLTLGDIEFGVGQDLFPKDFIINIPPPSNYIGPARVFGLPPLEATDEEVVPLDIVRSISDYKELIPDRHKKDAELPAALPPSLHMAVKCFILTCAARAARGQTVVHNSMLVHVSRFIRWQDHVATLLDGVLKTYRNRIEMDDQAFITELEQLWNKEYVGVTRSFVEGGGGGYSDPEIREVPWSEVRANLRSSSAVITVRAVHGTGARTDSFYRDVTPLDYNAEEAQGTRLSVIAVGGNKLSRGLTLEGLSVSYYLRASQMYDTLMQMGRWFGYRPGYADLCRLFTSAELRDWYKHIATASEELRREFDFMVALHRTPRQYGLKVRAHPGVLKVTAANKFRYAKEMFLSYSNTLAESYRLSLNPDALKKNRAAVDQLFARLKRVAPPDRVADTDHRFYGGDESAEAVQNFLRAFRVSVETVDGSKMADYISKQVGRETLTDWTVVLMSRTGAGPSATFDVGGSAETVGVFLRTQDDHSGPVPDDVYWIRKNHIISPEHEGLDLDEAGYERALKRTRQAAAERYKGPDIEAPVSKRPSGEMMRLERGARRGLLLIYPLTKDRTDDPTVEPVMGYAVSFPVIEGDVKVRYAVNMQFQKDLDYADEAEDEIDDA